MSNSGLLMAVHITALVTGAVESLPVLVADTGADWFVPLWLPADADSTLVRFCSGELLLAVWCVSPGAL